MVKRSGRLRSIGNSWLKISSYLLATLVVACCVVSVVAHKHSENPMLLLVSFDGFRWDYLNRYNLSNFKSLQEDGSYADYIMNVFPTSTFTNHWSIVTGLYPESHGILVNTMYDPVLNRTFSSLTWDTDVDDWFGQHQGVEPIWFTNQKAGANRKSAAEWVGAKAKIAGQSIYSIPFNHSTPFNDLVDQFMQMFTSEHDPINFGALYFFEPDTTGHLYGPDSSEIETAVRQADKTLGYLIEQLKSHHLYDKLNLIVTSDHGMASVSNQTAIYLQDYVDMNLIDVYGTTTVHTVFLKQSGTLEQVYKALAKIPNLDVYKKDDIPEELHIKNNPRVGDLLIIARFGYTIFGNRSQVDWTNTKGLHGYHTNNSDMHPIFIARGPAFKKAHRIKSFDLVDIYPMMCHVLGVKPAPNNGSLTNVAEILVHYFTSKLIMYTVFSLIPVFLASVTAFIVCFLNRKYFDKERIKTTNTNCYRVLSMSESTMELDMEAVEEAEQ